MRFILSVLIACMMAAMSPLGMAQTDSLTIRHDSLNLAVMQDYNKKLQKIEQQRIVDSLKREELESKLHSLKTTDNLKKEELQNQLQEISSRESQRIAQKKASIDSLRQNSKGYPVYGIMKDTLFYVFAKIGASTPHDRARNISGKLQKLYDNDFLKIDSITIVKAENTFDIVYGETIIMSISETDALWSNKSIPELAIENSLVIKNALETAKKENSLLKILIRIGLVLLVLVTLYVMIWLIGKGYLRFINYITNSKKKWLKSITYKNYTLLSEDQEFNVILFVLKISKYMLIAALLYIALPLTFSIFPFSRGWADILFNLVWSPLKSVFISVYSFLPNLFSILVIYFVMKYFIRFVKYIFTEIEAEKLKISGFHADWAMPTYSIVKFLLYAFMFVLIFPFLPGSDSNIFKGVSVFLGILFSLGSSSAIANMVAGLVITYMRPYKIGDRIKLGDISGDVVEKTLLVTRLRTVKNEEITIPNSSILSGNTINYSAYAKSEGLILHTNVTLGYDVPWKDINQALIDAALMTDFVLHDTKPFVLQVSLDDFYVTYQLNVFTKEANKQALIYSLLHQNIQDKCNQMGIEILSPHYRGQRDGNVSTIPANYLPEDYIAPSFNVKIENQSKT